MVKTLIVRIADQSAVLGLPSSTTGKPYELNAEVIEPSQVNFIADREFLNFLREQGEVALRVPQQLGETYHSAIAEMRTIGLSHSVGEKLIGASRETVTRLFGEFKRKQLV
jgi:CRP-like cAMP-binding protein